MSPILDINGDPYPSAFERWVSKRVFALLGLLVAVAGVAGFELRHYLKPPAAGSVISLGGSSPFYINGPLTLSPRGSAYADKPLRNATPADQASLGRALAAWKKALPRGFQLPEPGLYEGIPATCESDAALACADTKTGMIVISQRREQLGFDMDSVLMHEVGHLLGVPHIEDDPLMNAQYMGKVTAPTSQAVALALLHAPERKK